MIKVECNFVGNIDRCEVVCLKLYIRKFSLGSCNACFREVFFLFNLYLFLQSRDQKFDGVL
jgi:hypothetical protein